MGDTTSKSNDGSEIRKKRLESQKSNYKEITNIEEVETIDSDVVIVNSMVFAVPPELEKGGLIEVDGVTLNSDNLIIYDVAEFSLKSYSFDEKGDKITARREKYKLEMENKRNREREEREAKERETEDAGISKD